MKRSYRRSDIDSFFKCPQQYEYSHIQKLRRRPGIAAIAGTSIHAAIDHNWQYKLEHEDDAPVDELLDVGRTRFDKELDKQGTDFLDGDPNALIPDAVDTVVKTIGVFSEVVSPMIFPAETELPLAMMLGDEIEMTCTLDLITDARELWDFKSGKSTNQAAANVSRQLTWYAAAYKAHFDDDPADLGLIHIMKTKAETYRTSRTKEDFDDLFARVMLADKLIQAGLFPPCDNANSQAWWCTPKFCGYHRNNGGPCPFGRRG